MADIGNRLEPDLKDPVIVPTITIEQGNQEMALLQTIQRKNPDGTIDGPGYSCVEFHIQDMGAVYQSKIWEAPLKGLFFLVKEGSSVLAHLHTGDEIRARYTPVNRREPGDYIKTRIRYIIQEQTGRFSGHYLVGLLMMEDPE